MISRLIVHFMSGGQTPCGMPLPPSSWPDHHRWEGDWQVVNCAKCLDVQAGRAPGPKVDKLLASPSEMVGALMRKLRPVPPEEAQRREVEAQRALIEQADERAAQLLRQSGAPARQLKVKELHVCGAWGEKLTKLASMLGSGFLVALIGGKNAEGKFVSRGTGKTQLGVELIRHLSKRGAGSFYATAMQFFMDVKATYRDGSKEWSERDVIRRYAQKSLLVLDEIGKRGETDWEDRLLFELLDRRYREGRDTLLASNQERAVFEEAVGPSIMSRLAETGGVIECTWESFR